MKAIEATATINEEGLLSLDFPLDVSYPHRVRVIVLIPEAEDIEDELDDESKETAIEGIREGWRQAIEGEVQPISKLWDSLDVE